MGFSERLKVVGGPFDGGELAIGCLPIVTLQSCQAPPLFAQYENRGVRWVYLCTITEEDKAQIREDVR